MSVRGRFELDYDQLPIIFEAQFGNQNVYIGLNYNESGQFFTADLYDSDFQPVVMGERLVYGKRLWRRLVDPEVPKIDLVPLDEANKETAITKDNFGKTVFLYQDTLILSDEEEANG
ncbi:phage baseplate plug family protein [Lacticaseibacillus saniviri]|uniref:Cyanophage baseplate Pam3 plug gp18 domain-containing protein n=1 Tax=Lacticaseibacillus saniviri JCM 17471 = DSM 24301 TaxID=1293598 RepID=A0A0R2MQI7_9LACO|nr:hypothetical protein [Lacticaseibacillus saniviri]KRO15905.1 hypothetical protein IV56_GL002096 [Lacticaseibacillus saniviri JCM 17471 = DSM 24301]